MAPKKRQKYNKWPDYVTVSNKVYVVYRPYIKKKERHLFETDSHGYLKPPIKLGKLGVDSNDKILRAYIAARDKIELDKQPDRHTLYWVSEQYQQSAKFKGLSSKRDRQYKAKILDHPIKIDRQERKLGDLKVQHLDKPLIRTIMHKRREQHQSNGRDGRATINSEVTYISSMLTWAVNEVHGLPISNNPLAGIQYFKQPSRERVITEKEYQLQKEQAGYLLPYIFEIMYLCACRSIEVRMLNDDSILEEGLYIKRTKGSDDNIIRWTPRLRAAVDGARRDRVRPKVVEIGKPTPLFTNHHGERITRAALGSWMKDLKTKMKSLGMEKVYWTTHMLKHRGVTNAKNKKIAGHRSDSMMRIYDHEIPIVGSAEE